jgi:hypothetical protein
MRCLGVRNCDLRAWLGGLDLLLRQAAFLVRNRNGRRRPPRRGGRGEGRDGRAQDNAWKGSHQGGGQGGEDGDGQHVVATWHRGSLPDGRSDELLPAQAG